jgi:hypothetical protein
MYGWTTEVGVPANVGCVTEWVRVALGPAVVPVATPPAGFDVVAVMPVVAESVLSPSAVSALEASIAPCS